MKDFRKVKFSGSRVTLRWEEMRKGGRETIRHEMEADDPPAPSFHEALAALVPEVLELLELPDDYSERFRVSGVSVNYEEDGNRGFVVTCQKALEDTNAPLILNTPHLRQDPGEGEGVFAPPELVSRVDGVLREAQRYLDGHRAQGELFETASEDQDQPAGSTIELLVGGRTTGPIPSERFSQLCREASAELS